MPRPFLTARWSNLCILSYRVPRALLEGRLPRGLELDVPRGTPADEGVVSLVAFDFLDTRVRGVRVPRCVNFPEINLRFYARFPGVGAEADRRGVVFIRELVPRGLVSMVARMLYNEPYQTLAMHSTARPEGGKLAVEHRVMPRGASKPSTVRVTGAASLVTPSEGTLEHWFKEHQWGFGRGRSGEPLVYEVRHPVWRVHTDVHFDLDFDWARLFGHEWGVLSGQTPLSVLLAEGSRIEVDPKRSLKWKESPTASRTPGV